jgi:hypothetical protein
MGQIGFLRRQRSRSCGQMRKVMYWKDVEIRFGDEVIVGFVPRVLGNEEMVKLNECVEEVREWK